MNPQRPNPAVLMAVFLCLAGVVGGLLIQDRVRAHRRDDDRDRAAAAVVAVAARLDVAAAATSELAVTARDGLGAFTVAVRVGNESALDSAVLTGGSDRRVVAAVGGRRFEALRVGADVGDVAGLDATLEAVAASGAPRLGEPIEVDGAEVVPVVAPVYPAFLPDVGDRREQLQGYVIGVVEASRLLAHGAETGDVEIVSPGGAVLRREPIDELVLAESIEVLGAAWTARVGEARFSTSPVPWLVAFAGLVSGLVVGLTMQRQQRGRRRAEDRAVDRARQLELIAQTSAELQQSLDLGDVLPAFAVAVATEFGLDGVRIGVTRDDGQVHEAFRLGEPPDGPGADRLLLRRGWRTVGELAVHTPRPLDAVERQSLQALADLLAVAIGNAQLFEREQTAVARLRELDALKNAFLGTVSHELRTSTTAVMGFGEVLTESWDVMSEERRKELAERIRRSAGSLRHLVDDLLDYARLEHQRLRVDPRPISLSGLVRQLSDSMAPLVTDHHVVVDAEGEVEAWVDPVAVERILANLLSNAGKYSPPGTTVTVRVQAAGDQARLTVADQGPGIPPEERSRVFVRFYRLDNEETVRTRGAGIGLAILRDFADRSGATVRIDDAPGGGALIEVDFPTAPPPPTADDDVPTAESVA